MKDIFYKKVGRKYVPVSEYDGSLMCAMPEGFHVIHVRPGCKSYRYKIDPADATVVAALGKLRDKLQEAAYKATAMSIDTQFQSDTKFMKAYNEFQKKINHLPIGTAYGHYKSRHEVVEEIMGVIEQELGVKK